MAYIEINQNQQTHTAVVLPSVISKPTFSDAESKLAEAIGLARAINLDVSYTEIVRLREVKPATYFSKGFFDRVKPIFETKQIDLLVVDASLTPIQQRNLEKALKIKVIDRTALILEIFGERAQTKEGKLQVELAHLTYQRSRLVRSWTHLERQRGGAGFLGGPGETQIELDRRIIDDKIVRIKKELEKVKKTRELQRSARKKIPYPVVALVGYTNAGKSTLFNFLSSAGVFAENLLFATLDPTMRRINLPSGKEIILSDTVGFISDLPHELIMSFRATLEEVLEADVVVHVRDMSNPDNSLQKKDVLNVLHNLGLKNIENDHNYIEVLNKTDLLSDEDKGYLRETTARSENSVAASAITGEGTQILLQLIDKKLSAKFQNIETTINAADGKLIAWIYKNAEVLSSDIQEEHLILCLRADAATVSRLKNKARIKTLD